MHFKGRRRKEGREDGGTEERRKEGREREKERGREGGEGKRVDIWQTAYAS